MRGTRRDTRAEAPTLPARWIVLLCALLGVGLMVASRPPATYPGTRMSHPEAHVAITRGAPPSTEAHPVPARLRGVDSRPTSSSSRSTTASPVSPVEQVAARSTPSAVVPAASSPPTLPTTVPTTTPAVVPPSSASRTSVVVQQGWLQGPTWTSAVYQSPGSGPRAIVARWTSGARLTLTASCAGGTQQLVATTVASLSVPAGSCTVTLAGDAATPLTTYSIDLGAA